MTCNLCEGCQTTDCEGCRREEESDTEIGGEQDEGEAL